VPAAALGCGTRTAGNFFRSRLPPSHKTTKSACPQRNVLRSSSRTWNRIFASSLFVDYIIFFFSAFSFKTGIFLSRPFCQLHSLCGRILRAGARSPQLLPNQGPPPLLCRSPPSLPQLSAYVHIALPQGFPPAFPAFSAR